MFNDAETQAFAKALDRGEYRETKNLQGLEVLSLELSLPQ